MSAYRLASQRLRGSSVSAASYSSSLPVVMCALAGLVGGGAVANAWVSPYARRYSVDSSSNGAEVEPTNISLHMADFRKTYVLSTYVSTRARMDQACRGLLDGDSASVEPSDAKR